MEWNGEGGEGRARPSERRETRAARKAASDGRGPSPEEERRHLQPNANGTWRRERPLEAGWICDCGVRTPSCPSVSGSCLGCSMK